MSPFSRCLCVSVVNFVPIKLSDELTRFPQVALNVSMPPRFGPDGCFVGSCFDFIAEGVFECGCRSGNSGVG